MKETPQTVIELPDGSLLCTETRAMTPGQGGNNALRQVEFRFPAMALDPVATFTVVAGDGSGTIFGITSAVFNLVNDGHETQVVVEARNVEGGVPSDEDFFCSCILAGMPPEEELMDEDS